MRKNNFNQKLLLWSQVPFKYLLSECSLKKGIFWNLLFHKFKSVPHIWVVDIAVNWYFVDKLITLPRSLVFPSPVSNVLLVTYRANDHIYQIATLAGFKIKHIPCSFEGLKMALLNAITTSTSGFSAFFALVLFFIWVFSSS